VSKTLEEVIYQVRWVDGIKKDPAMVSDAGLAKAIEEAGWTQDPLEDKIRERIETLKERRKALWQEILRCTQYDYRIRESMVRAEYEEARVEQRVLESLLP